MTAGAHSCSSCAAVQMMLKGTGTVKTLAHTVQFPFSSEQRSSLFFKNLVTRQSPNTKLQAIPGPLRNI